MRDVHFNIIRYRRKDFFLEIYKEGRYFTVTGDVYGGIKNIKPIETRTAELQAIHNKFLLPDPARNIVRMPQSTSSQNSMSTGIPNANQGFFLNTGLKRDKVFAALWLDRRRIGNESSDDIALMNKLAYWCNADPDAMIRAFLSSPYHTQKDETHKKKCQRSDYLPKTANNTCATSILLHRQIMSAGKGCSGRKEVWRDSRPTQTTEQINAKYLILSWFFAVIKYKADKISR